MRAADSMLAKGVRVLSYLADAPAGAKVSEIARALEMPTSTVHRLLATLVEEGWVSHNARHATYRLGMRVLFAAESLRVTLGLNDMHHALVALAKEVGETVILGKLVGQRFIYIDFIQGPSLLGIRGSAGQFGPLHCTATGKALLMPLPLQMRSSLINALSYEPHTPRTHTSPNELAVDLQESISRGYVTSDEEYEVGVTSIGMPIVLGESLEEIYSLTISAPKQRATPERIQFFVQAMQNTRMALRVNSGVDMAGAGA